MPQHILKVDDQNHRTRLDIFLARNLPDVPSRTFVQRLIEGGQVTVNQKSVKANHQIVQGDEVIVELPEEIPSW